MTTLEAEFWRDPRTGRCKAVVDGRYYEGREALEQMRRWNAASVPAPETAQEDTFTAALGTLDGSGGAEFRDALEERKERGLLQSQREIVERRNGSGTRPVDYWWLTGDGARVLEEEE